MKKFMLVMLLCVTFSATAFCQNDRVLSALEPASPSAEPASQSDWHITRVPAYLWLSGVGGNLGVAGKTIPISASFSDIFDKLNIGYMTAFAHTVGNMTSLQEQHFMFPTTALAVIP